MGNSPSKATFPEPDAVDEKAAEYAATQRLLEGLRIREGEASATVKKEALKEWEATFLRDPKNRLAIQTFSKADITTTLASTEAHTKDIHIFNLRVPFEATPVVNQKASGRCWLFATTNVLRHNTIKQLNLGDFQFSQSYLSFYDKLEKANTYLENSIELADEEIDSRVVSFINGSPVGDGGQWDMAVNLLEKYGLVPQPIYPESYNSSNSSRLNWLLTVKLREHALELRKLAASLRSTGQHSDAQALKLVRRRKTEQIEEIYGAMVIALGPPPKADEKFAWEYYDKDGKFHSITSTPLEFAKKYTQGFKPSNHISLVNDPRNEYSKLYTVDRLKNVWDGRPVLYVNTTAERLKDAIVTNLKAGRLTFIGIDSGQFSDRNGGLWDIDIYDYELAFNLKLGLTKAQRLATGDSSMTHAVVISGAHIVDGKPVRFRIENSWSPDAGEKGYFLATAGWVDQFLYQVVIDRDLAPADLVAVFDKGDPVAFKPWDPMGTLA